MKLWNIVRSRATCTEMVIIIMAATIVIDAMATSADMKQDSFCTVNSAQTKILQPAWQYWHIGSLAEFTEHMSRRHGGARKPTSWTGNPTKKRIQTWLYCQQYLNGPTRLSTENQGLVTFLKQRWSNLTKIYCLVSSAVWAPRIALEMPPIERYDISASKLYLKQFQLRKKRE